MAQRLTIQVECTVSTLNKDRAVHTHSKRFTMYHFISYSHIDRVGYDYLVTHAKSMLTMRSKREGRTIKAFRYIHTVQDNIPGIRLEPMFDISEWLI